MSLRSAAALGRGWPEWLLLVALGAFVPTRVALAQGEPSSPPDAHAGDGDPVATADEMRVVELNERGSALYADGDYRRAVELFLQAYAIASDPNLLFNIAACYEGSNDRDAALEKYRAFLAAPNADPDGRPRAEAAIERLLAIEGELAPPPPSQPIAPVTIEPAPPAPSPTRLGPPTDDLPTWVPWAVWGGGAALGVTGVAVYLLGVADHHQVTSAPGYDDPHAVVDSSRQHAEALVASGDTKKVVGATTAAVGGAAMAGYVLWRMLERPDESPRPSIDVALSPSAASLSWSGRF